MSRANPAGTPPDDARLARLCSDTTVNYQLLEAPHSEGSVTLRSFVVAVSGIAIFIVFGRIVCGSVPQERFEFGGKIVAGRQHRRVGIDLLLEPFDI